MNIKRAFNISLLFLVTVLVPVVVVLTAVRIVIHPWYLEFEYHTPGFPADPYGFTLQERLQYARLAVDYLLNDQGIQFLADLHFPAGQQAPENSCQFMEDCTRLFNDRELEHMLDVKRVVGAAFRVWLAGLALLVIGGLIAWRMKAWKDYRLALSSIEAGADEAREEVPPGTVAYWPPGRAMCLFFGQKPYSPVNVVGHLNGDPRSLTVVEEGEPVRVERI